MVMKTKLTNWLKEATRATSFRIKLHHWVLFDEINSRFFWRTLKGEPMGAYGESPWQRCEITPDWDLYRLKNELEEIGVHFTEGGGQCPVQVDGYIGPYNVYFRARGRHWCCEFTDGSNENSEVFSTDGPWGSYDYHAGYMPLSKVFGFISESVNEFSEHINRDNNRYLESIGADVK